MALDLGREVSFKGLKGKFAGNRSTSTDDLPAKTSINLIAQQKEPADKRKVVALVIVAIVLVALVGKFGIYDFHVRVNEARAELDRQQTLFTDLATQLEGFNEVKATYDAYESANLMPEGSTVSTLDALALVDTFIRPEASVNAISYEHDTLTLSLSDISLGRVGDLTKTLDEQDMVASVVVSTATTGEESPNDDVTAALTIVLQGSGGAR